MSQTSLYSQFLLFSHLPVSLTYRVCPCPAAAAAAAVFPVDAPSRASKYSAVAGRDCLLGRQQAEGGCCRDGVRAAVQGAQVGGRRRENASQVDQVLVPLQGWVV